MRRNVMMIICLIGMAVSMNAQTLSGKLVDEKNEPLAFANVVLLQADSTFVSGTITDEMGDFRILKDEKGTLVRISSIGYTTIYKKVNGGDFGVIQMVSDAQLLGEVVVKGDLPVTRVKGDALVTSVAGTLLEKAGTAEDLLDKIPNVTAENGSVKVFGRGTPEIYINGRKVRDTNELDRLESDNIKSVEVINNPGARYDASVTSVIRIITKKAQGDGFGFNNRAYASYNDKWTGLEQLDMNYRTGGFDFGGMVRYWNTYRIEDKVQNKWTYLDNEFRQDLYSISENKSDRFGAQFSVNYAFNPNHSIGARYDYFRTPESGFDGTSTDEIFVNGELDEISHSTGSAFGQTTKHSANVYYSGKVNEWTIDWNMDGVWNKSHEDQQTNATYRQTGKEEQNERVTTSTRTSSELYATKLVFTHPLAGGSLSFGGEYTHTQRNNLYTNPQGIIADDDSYAKEGTGAGFLEYGRQIGKVNLQAGLRYEHVTFDYYKDDVYRSDLSRSYSNLFPSLSMAFPLGKVQMMLSYAKDVQRPSYGDLSSEISYANRYTYQTGNPLLLPMMTDNLNLNAVYRWIHLQMGYQHVEDEVFYYSAPYSEDNPSIALISLINHPGYDKVYASLTLSPKVGIWSPQLSGQVIKQWIKLDTPFGRISANEPFFNMVWRNGFKLPAGFTFNANVYWQTKGNFGNAYMFRHTWKMDFSLQKSFLKNKLSVQLDAKNPFQTYKNNSAFTYLGDLETFRQDFNNSQYSYTLNIRYKFNTTKSKYKGTGAGASQKARM